MGKLLKVGTEAPEFVLTGTDDRTVASADYRGHKNLVLAFYPKDNTSG
jgi:peroxiredoxin